MAKTKVVWDYKAAGELLLKSEEIAAVCEEEAERMTRATGMDYVADVYGGPATFDIVFNCKPQRYLFSGLEAITFPAPGSLNNPYMTALPLITVYGSGDGEISVGGTVVRLVGQTDVIQLDCDLQNAYHETAAGILENRNNQISAPAFPKLLPGINAVSFSGGVERIEIIPRWWTL